MYHFSFLFFFYTLAQPARATIEDTFPATVQGDVLVAETHVGATQKLCVQGKSPHTNTYWTKAGVQIPAVYPILVVSRVAV